MRARFPCSGSSITEGRQPSDSLTVVEEGAVEKLMIRRSLLLGEEGWSRLSYYRNFLGKNGQGARGPPELGCEQ